MIVLATLAAVYCALVGTFLVRRGLRTWRRRGAEPRGPGSVLLTYGAKAGFERAALVFGAFHYCLGALIACVASLNATGRLGRAHQRPSEFVGIILLILLVGVVGSVWTGIAITWFNRPRFLVPPPLRDEPGMVSIRRHGSVSRTRRPESGRTT